MTILQALENALEALESLGYTSGDIHDEMKRILLTKSAWILMYGGQALLDAEGFDVVSCDDDCDDSICHGWKVVRKGGRAE